MTRSVLKRFALAAALVLTIPTMSAAQVATPEDVDWHLVRYVDGSEEVAVPWYVEATLHLEDGRAHGSAACNSFSGEYTLEGDRLTFGALGRTEMACPEPIMAIENSYMAALDMVTTWVIDSGPSDRLLYLRADPDEDLLVFESAALSLTRSDIDALVGELQALRSRIDRHEERIDNIRIGAVRDRIKALEAAAATSSQPDLSAFTAAEKVLLSGVRSDIAGTCEPRRSQNPTGTIAALQCRPDTTAVADMAYYLMEDEEASRVWQQRMKDYKVKDGTQNRACAFNKPSMMFWVGGGTAVAGCYRNEDGAANLRFVHPAAECRQLTAGATQVKNPSVYIAVLGPDRSISNLYEWAASSTDWEHGEDLFDPIRQPGQPWSSQCPR